MPQPFAPYRRRLLSGTFALALSVSAMVGLQLGTGGSAGAWPAPTVTITGHGYGHGRGMGQYGAYGYALQGQSWGWILGHYYGGTSLGTNPRSTISVDLSDFDGHSSVTVTSGHTFYVGGHAIGAGSAVRINAIGSAFALTSLPGGCTSRPRAGTVGVPGGGIRSAVADPGDALASMITVCDTGRSYRGTLQLLSSGGHHLVNTLRMEDYLRGVVPRESPAYWGDPGNAGGKGVNALAAQAVAARSYAAVQSRYSYAQICDNQNCQVYGGAGLNGQRIEDYRTDTAIAMTSGVVLRNASGVVSAEYSSSTGGYTAGGTFPAVVDAGDSVAANPNHNWTTTVSVGSIESAFGVGRLSTITVLGRNGLGADGGRVERVRVSGSAGSRDMTGGDFQSALGLKSNWFSITSPPHPQPLVYLSYSTGQVRVDAVQAFGRAGDLPIACDFDGNGSTTMGVYRPSNRTFYLRNSLATGSPLVTVTLGLSGDQPVCGDWDGNGSQTVGVYRASSATFYLLNGNSRSGPLTQFRLGAPGDRPVAGDWTGQHRDTVGVYRPSTSTFYLTYTNATSAPRHAYAYGNRADANRPVVGDWDGNHTDTLGVYHDNVFFLSNRLGAGHSLEVHFGRPGDAPVAGDWARTGRDSVGVARSYSLF